MTFVMRGFDHCTRISPVRNTEAGVTLDQELLQDLGNNAGTDGTATLTDSETQALLDSDGGDQLNAHHDVIAGHAHLNALGQSDDAGHVSGTEVELRTVVVEEGSQVL